MLDVKLKNYREDVGVGGLMKEELDVLRAVLFEVLAKNGMPQKGTFVLRAQTLKQETSGICDFRNVMSFNFPKGEKKHFLGEYRGSDVMANWTLNDAVCYSRQVEMGGTIRHGYNQPTWMTVETDAGRIIAIFLADNGDMHTQEKVYLTLTKTLTMLCPNDATLQHVASYTFNAVFDDELWVKKLEKSIEEMFNEHELSEVTTWKKWRERNPEHLLIK